MHAKRPNLAFAMLLALFGYLLPISLIQAATPAINLCVDDNFAPFEYASPASNSTAHVVRGATISMVERILNRHQISYSIKWLPWTRCLAYVKSGNIQIGMDAYYDARRDQDIAYSEPYYTLTPQYYYSRQRFPHGLGIKWRTNLKQYRGCGVLGYSYTHYGLGKSDIDSGAQDHACGRAHCKPSEVIAECCPRYQSNGAFSLEATRGALGDSGYLLVLANGRGLHYTTTYVHPVASGWQC